MFVFYFFAVVLIWLGVLSLRGGWRFYDYFRIELQKGASDFAPFASIIAPCRGLDDGLRENLAALFQQNYPAFEIIFVVDDARNAAVEIIREVSHSFTNSTIVVAGEAFDSGQKVHNLRRAVAEISNNSEILVFVDSDARPSENWLRSLVAPLADESVGAASGYRWFVAKNDFFPAQLRSVWNASIASALGANQAKNFCWGGATAIRRATFERLEMLEKWRGAASDDFALTNALQAAKLPIYFVPQCLTPSIENCTLSELIEFSTRQMKITRVYAAPLWKASLIGSLLFSAIFWTGVLLVILRAANNFSVWLELILLIIIFALGAAKSWIRLRAVKLVLPNYERQLNTSLKWHLTLWTITPILYFYNCLRAAFSRRIVWRGISYELKSPRETIVLSKDEEF